MRQSKPFRLVLSVPDSGTFHIRSAKTRTALLPHLQTAQTMMEIWRHSKLRSHYDGLVDLRIEAVSEVER